MKLFRKNDNFFTCEHCGEVFYKDDRHYDEITEKDIKAAETAGVGIFLVNSKNYYNPDDALLRKYQRHIDYYNSNYFDGVNKQKFEDNR